MKAARNFLPPSPQTHQLVKSMNSFLLNTVSKSLEVVCNEIGGGPTSTSFEFSHLAGDIWHVHNTVQPRDCRPNPFNKPLSSLQKELPKSTMVLTEHSQAKSKIVVQADDHSRLQLEISGSPNLDFTFRDRRTGALLFQEEDGSLHLGKGGGFQIHQMLSHHTEFYGLGERTSFKKNDRKYHNWASDAVGVYPHIYGPNDDPLYKCFPFLLCSSTIEHLPASSGGPGGKPTSPRGNSSRLFFGIFVDNHSYQEWDFKAKSMTIKATEGPLSYYIFAAERPLEVIAKYNLLTGYMPLPPVWALGYHQCRWSYHPAARVKEIMEQFRKREIPCDSVWMDIDYMDGFRCFTFDKKKGFDPKDMVEYGKERGIRPIVILDPGIKVDEHYSVYQQLMQGDHALKLVLNDEAKQPYVGKVWPDDCVFPDFTQERTREWWGGLYKEMVDAGIEGYWNDMNEPAIFNDTMTMPENVKSSIGMHPFFHNVYGAMMARATYEGIKKLKPDTRPFVLTRSGFSGVQRFAWSWTGDNYSTWDHLRLSIPMCLSMCLSGMSGIGVDIGGFEKDCTPELFTRWIQMGTFFPFMRVHSAKTTKDQEPWSFGEEVEIISKRFIQLRYRLIPYIYTWLRHCSQTGEPLMRALFLEFPHDASCYEARWEETQFFLGPSLLVAPQLHELQMSREVYFPPAPEGWFNFFTKELVTPNGGVVVTVPTPLDTLPLFVRGNTVIPTKYKARRNVQDTLSKEPYEFLAFGKDLSKCQGLLYEDDGVSWAHQDANGFKLHQLNQFGIVRDS